MSKYVPPVKTSWINTQVQVVLNKTSQMTPLMQKVGKVGGRILLATAVAYDPVAFGMGLALRSIVPDDQVELLLKQRPAIKLAVLTATVAATYLGMGVPGALLLGGALAAQHIIKGDESRRWSLQSPTAKDQKVNEVFIRYTGLLQRFTIGLGFMASPLVSVVGFTASLLYVETEMSAYFQQLSSSSKTAGAVAGAAGFIFALYYFQGYAIALSLGAVTGHALAINAK